MLQINEIILGIMKKKNINQAELVRRINKEEESIGWETKTRVQHINNMLKNNYISKLRALKIERALELNDGFISDLVKSKEQEYEKYKEMLQCTNTRK